MQKLSCLTLFLFSAIILLAQPQTESGIYYIHKFQQNIGKETYNVTKAGDAFTYNVHFNYVDRGSPVDLRATLRLGPSLAPQAFRIKGGTSRFSAVNDSVVVSGKTAFIKVDDSSCSKPLQANSFPVAGYSPATAQSLLIQYWKKNGKPTTIHTLPFGEVQISEDGQDTLLGGNKQVVQRFVIKGLIWGNELVWTGPKGQLVCLITNDAEGDKQEIVYAPFESTLPFFIDKAAFYGMRLFTKGAKPSLQTNAVMAITGGNLVNVVNGAVTPNATVLIENGRIKYAGSPKEGIVPKNATVINAKGQTILPGLWDMHAHFEQAEWGPAYLAAGVTTVRDCGNEFDYINAIKAAIDGGTGVGPQILKAGIIDGKGPYALGIVQADTKEEAVAAVRRYKQSGFVQIKIYSSVKPAIVKVICDEAHRLGLTVTGHIPIGMTLMQGVDSGMDMVNHLQYVFSVVKRIPKTAIVNLDDSVSQAVFRFIKTHNVVMDPTLGVFELGWRSLKDSITIIEPAFATLPAPMKPLFINTGSADSTEIAFGKQAMQSFKQITHALYQGGTPIVAGTDMGFPGYSLDRELELYVESGLTPLQAIQTATITPARVMKLDAAFGSVEAGKNADIILVDGNPLQNIRDIRKVRTVIREGKIYDPNALHRMAGFSAN